MQSKRFVRFLVDALFSILFWFLINVIFCVALIWLRFFRSPYQILNDDIFNIIFSIASGGIISFLFYFLVVYVPEVRRSSILKANIISIYRSVRNDVVFNVVMASRKGGRYDLSAAYDDMRKLADVKEFKSLFSGGRQATEGFYAFQNQMMERTYEFEKIIQEIKLLSSQVDFFLHKYVIRDAYIFSLLKRFELRLLSLLDSQAGYEESKPLCAFIYEWLAGWDPVTGYRDRDIFLEALQKA